MAKKIIYKGLKNPPEGYINEGVGKQFFLCEEPVKELRDGKITFVSLDKKGLVSFHWLGTPEEAKEQFDVIDE